MKLSWKIIANTGLSVALPLLVSLAQAQNGVAPAGRGFVMDPIDSRVQQRSYLFTDTDETLPYAVFVPSTYSKDKKTPLVLALHGFSGSHATFMRTACVDEAEKYGFILVGPMGIARAARLVCSSRWAVGVAPEVAERAAGKLAVVSPVQAADPAEAPDLARVRQAGRRKRTRLK